MRKANKGAGKRKGPAKRTGKRKGPAKPTTNGTGITPVIERELISAHVPMIFNGYELRDVEHTALKCTITDFIRRFKDRIDLRPPYQRDEAWSMKKGAQFIASCFSKTMHIPPLILAKKTDSPRCTDYWALDCRQRVTAIINFLANKFRIDIVENWNDGAHIVKKLYWAEIQRVRAYESLVNGFSFKDINITIFEFCSEEDQRKIFTALNNGESLNPDEQNYCYNFLARKVLSHCFDQIFPSITTSLQAKVRERRRFAHIRTAHEALILCAGIDMRQSPESRALRQSDRQDSAKKMHDLLRTTGFNYTDVVDDDVLEQFDLKNTVSQLRGITEILAEVFLINKNLGREEGQTSVSARNLIDPLGFLFKCIFEERTTIASLSRKKKDIAAALGEYDLEKVKISANQTTSDAMVMRKKYEAMNALFIRRNVVKKD